MVHQVACKRCGDKLRAGNHKAADYPGTVVGVLSKELCSSCNSGGKKSRKIDYSQLRIYIIKVWWPEGGYEYLRTAGWSDKDATGRMSRRLQEAGTPAKLLQIHSTAKLPV